jgi:hypothetical protein
MRSDRSICWKEQVWAETSDNKRYKKGEMVEGLSIVVCFFYPMECFLDILGVGRRRGGIIYRKINFMDKRGYVNETKGIDYQGRWCEHKIC